MGPTINTVTKKGNCLQCINSVSCYPGIAHIHKLKNGYIISFDDNSKLLKFYKFINNCLSLLSNYEIEDRPTSIFELEENILLIGSYMKLLLFDINDLSNLKLIQTIPLSYENNVKQILQLSNGLIVTNDHFNIAFYKYDYVLKKLEKVKECNFSDEIEVMFELDNGNLLIKKYSDLIIYYPNENITKKIEQERIFEKENRAVYNFVDNHLIISYNEKSNFINTNINIYNIDFYNFKLQLQHHMQIDYYYLLNNFLKLNDKILIAYDDIGNIHEFEIGVNFYLTKKDVFWAHVTKIVSFCKQSDNLFITINDYGEIKLWMIQ